MKKLITTLVALAALCLSAFVARAEITYPVDVEGTRWAVIDTNTNEILVRYAKWPRADGQPIVGQATNEVYLLETGPNPPQYDPRVFTLAETSTPYVVENKMRTTYTAVRRPQEEIKTSARNVEAERLLTLNNISPERETLETRLAVAAIIWYIKGQQLPSDVMQFINHYEQTGVKIWENRRYLLEQLNKIEAGESFDLDGFPYGTNTVGNAPVPGAPVR